MRIIFIYLLIFSCSNVDTNKGTVDQIPVPTSIVSFFENKPEIIRLDSSYTPVIEIWTQMINFTEKFSDLIDNEINHKSKIKSLSIELKKIKKGIDNTTGGIILWDIKKNVISLFLTIPALKV